MKHCRGFSLVEMMVTSTIGLLLLSAVAGLFLSSSYSAKQTSMRGGLYENGRYALLTLNDELRVADFWGGAHSLDIAASGSLNVIASDCTGAALGYDLLQSLWAMTASSANALGCISDATLNSDILVIKRVAQTPTPVVSLDAALTYVMSNETKGVLFDGSDTPPTTTNGGDVPNGQPWEYTGAIFYVAANADGIPTLYRKRLTGNQWGNKEEVALGVERLHLLLGIDNTGDGAADVFRDADNAVWGNVVSAHVYLLVRSESENKSYTDSKSYQLGDLSIAAANDRYHRLVFDTSVNLRNRRLTVAGGY